MDFSKETQYLASRAVNLLGNNNPAPKVFFIIFLIVFLYLSCVFYEQSGSLKRQKEVGRRDSCMAFI
jgi:p-aminobenzoyl-glutamate transporter AbgT